MEDFESYARAWRQRRQEAIEASRNLAERAGHLADRLARILKVDFDARRVWLIGSLVRGRFGPGSDIDLVVEGMDPALFFRACARLQDEAQDIPVDLAPYEDLRPPTLRHLERMGIEL